MWSPESSAPVAEEAGVDTAAIEAELAAAKAQLQTAEQEFAAQSEALQQQRAAWEAEIAERQTALDRLDGELRQRQSSLTEEVAKLQHARQTLEAERAELQQSHRLTHDRLETKLAEVDEREAQLALRIAACESREAEVIQRRSLAESQATSLAAQRDALQIEVAAMQAQLAGSQAESQAAATALAEQRGEFDAEQLQWQEERHAMATQLDEQESQAATLRDELTELRARLEARLANDSIAIADDEASMPEAEASSNVDETTAPSEAMLALQRLRAAALCDSEDEEEAPPHVEAIVEEPQRATPPDRGGDESDVSIEDYMTQLMQRVRGKSEQDLPPAPKRRPAPAAPATKVVAAAPSAPASLSKAVVDERVKSDVPCKLETLRSLPARSAAPEQSSSLQAMRELANQSARSAIDTSALRRWQANVRAKFAVSVCSVVGGGALLTFSSGLLSWTTAAALGAFAAAGVFGVLGYHLRRQGGPKG
jgi:hypothetical protein